MFPGTWVDSGRVTVYPLQVQVRCAALVLEASVGQGPDVNEPLSSVGRTVPNNRGPIKFAGSVVSAGFANSQCGVLYRPVHRVSAEGAPVCYLKEQVEELPLWQREVAVFLPAECLVGVEGGQTPRGESACREEARLKDVVHITELVGDRLAGL